MDDLIERGLFRNRSHLIEEVVSYIRDMGIKKFLMEKLEGIGFLEDLIDEERERGKKLLSAYSA